MEYMETSKDSVFRWVAVCELIYGQTQGYLQAQTQQGTLPEFDFSNYYMLVSGLERRVYRRFFGMEAFDYTAYFRTVEDEIHTLLKAQGVRCISAMLLYDHTKRFVMLFNLPPSISAQDVAQIVSGCFNRQYAQIFEMGKTPYRNYTVLSEKIDSFDKLHASFHEMDDLSRQQFFDMRTMIMTTAKLEASRQMLDREQVHEELLQLSALMREGDIPPAVEKYRTLMSRLKAARDFRLLKDALSALHTTTFGILRSFGADDSILDRDAFLVSTYSTMDHLIEGVEASIIACRRNVRPMSQLIQEAVRYIRHHHAEDIAVADVAAHIGMSESWLTKRFKQECGQSIVNFLLDVRVEKAKELLAGTDKLILEIACEVGFENSGYFISVFRRVVGMTPKAYRQKMQEEKA